MMNEKWIKLQFSLRSATVTSLLCVLLVAFVMCYPFSYGPAFARDTGFPLAYEGWSDLGPTVYFDRWNLVLDLVFAFGLAIGCGVCIEAVMRKRMRCDKPEG